MKVLFVCSGNRNKGPSEVVLNQYNSLVNHGLKMDLYTIKGRGLFGYLKNIYPLRKQIKTKKYDIIHAHYSLTGIIAGLASASPLIVSLMGSDAHLSGLLKRLTLYSHRKFWNITILKSIEMNNHLNLKSYMLMPNGVDTERFKPMDIYESKKRLHFNKNEKIVVFIANPSREEKNYQLAQDAINLVKTQGVKLVPVYNIPNDEIPTYLNAADVLILTSKYEGSVNVVKEAMACDTPIVSTDVGDVKKNISGLMNCHLSESSSKQLAQKIDAVLSASNRSNGREQIFKKYLDSASVARKLIKTYEEQLCRE